MARWADNYRTGRVGGPPLLAAVTAGAVPQSNQPDALRYGAGIDVFPNGGLGHRGYWSGVNSAMAASADRHTTLAVSCNSEDPRHLGGGRRATPRNMAELTTPPLRPGRPGSAQPPWLASGGLPARDARLRIADGRRRPAPRRR